MANMAKICVTSTCFLLNEQFFKQESGSSMGSLLSPFTAFLYIEDLEQRAEFKPMLSYRYVDTLL